MAGPQEDLWDNRDEVGGTPCEDVPSSSCTGFAPHAHLYRMAVPPSINSSGGDLRTPAAVDAGVSAAAHVCRDSPCTWGTGHARAGSRAQVGIPQPRLLRV
eukprot:CAMPEP_0177202994 /NCGR_PEP_ID=MMETSP0367-20130122/27579_1 /TAXON_ID=447022 ORGANISM="Scrippsiella hangoei-like, Strain SHHI-4" /NCGR_SAMPLE_ID=MMETSP0367 /ASSEMBLY_ACC=CAM_ASM_000362 /LENGTH=100 /DNA_ID=CAMNT_0018651597 /DNA_START=247 /DNA_END=547 /DNA_ORIENTATION=+